VVHTGPKATDDIRVQLVNHRGKQRSYLVLDVASGSVHNRADKFLSAFCEGTQRTYAYHLVDHLRWLAVNGYFEDSITIHNLLRYLALCGTQHFGPMGTPWRASPLGESAQAVRAACLKGYHLDLTTREGVNAELRTALSTRRLPNDRDRTGQCLGTSPYLCSPTRCQVGRRRGSTLACCRMAAVRQCSMRYELPATG